MSSAERTSLKQKAKMILAQRSEDWTRVSHEANPAPLGSDLWMKNHLRAHENEHWLRTTRPDRILCAEVRQRFSLISSEETGLPEPYVECQACGDVLYSAPASPVSCSCGNITFSYRKKKVKLDGKGQVRAVRLIPKGNEKEPGKAV